MKYPIVIIFPEYLKYILYTHYIEKYHRSRLTDRQLAEAKAFWVWANSLGYSNSIDQKFNENIVVHKVSIIIDLR